MKLPKEVNKVTPLSKRLAMTAFIIFPFIFFFAGIKYQNMITTPLVNTEIKEAQITPVPSINPSVTNTAPSQTTTMPTASQETVMPVKVDASSIKFKLPTGWISSTINNDLHIGPSDGGYFNISAYKYDGSGRREYYCIVRSGYCIDATIFTAQSIGNISGYRADSIDNSGGGADYFGTKGSVFYIIEVSTPSFPSETEFSKHRDEVMKSLVF